MWTEAIVAAFGAAIYPPALLFIAYLLADPDPRKRSLAFLAGAVIATLSVGFTVVLLFPGAGGRAGEHRTLSAWIDVTLGAVLVLFALVVARRRPRGPKVAKERRELGLLALFLVGCLMYSPSPLYLASLHSVAKAHASTPVTMLSVLLVAAIYMSLIEAPIVLHTFWPDPTIRWVTTTNSWLAEHGRTLVVVVAGGFGGYLLVSGIGRLA